jgi:hypothetical protein
MSPSLISRTQLEKLKDLVGKQVSVVVVHEEVRGESYYDFGWKAESKREYFESKLENVEPDGLFLKYDETGANNGYFRYAASDHDMTTPIPIPENQIYIPFARSHWFSYGTGFYDTKTDKSEMKIEEIQCFEDGTTITL